MPTFTIDNIIHKRNRQLIGNCSHEPDILKMYFNKAIIKVFL